MKLIQILCLTLIVLIANNLNAQNFSWAGLIESSNVTWNYITDMETDQFGNTIVIGHFWDTTDFRLDTGAYFMHADSVSGRDLFIVKYDFFGNIVFANTLTTTYHTAYELELDDSGNIYFTTSFSGTCDMDPGPGVFNITGPALALCKWDNNGNFIFAKKIGFCGVNGMAVDQNENIVIAVDYWDDSLNVSTSTNPIFIHPLASSYLTIRFDSLGNYSWSKQFSGTGSYQNFDLDTDEFGNIYNVGRFFGSIDFNPGFNTDTLIADFYDSYISSYDVNGNFRWALKQTGSGFQSARSIKVKNNGIHVLGFFEDETIFDLGVNNDTFNQSNTSGFIAKYDYSGNYVFASTTNSISNFSTFYTRQITIDEKLNIYAIGSFYGTVDFNSDTSVFQMTSHPIYSSMYTYCLDSLGRFKWAISLTHADYSSSISIGPFNSIFIAGGVFIDGDFNPGSDTSFIDVPSAAWSQYILKLGDSISLPSLPLIQTANDTICLGDSILLSIDSGTLNNAENWVWYLDNCGNNKIGEGDSIWISPNKSQDIFVRGESSIITIGSCSKKKITVGAEVFLNHDSILCEGLGQSIMLDAGDGFASYLWSDGSTNQTLLVDEAFNTANGDIISVEVTDNNACRNSDTVSIGFSICGALSGTGTELINTIYPNPTSDRLIIELSKAEKVRLTIYDTKGGLMLEKRSDAKEIQLYLRDLPAAKYILKIQGDDIDVQTGIIKN